MRIETFAGILEIVQTTVDRMRLRTFGKRYTDKCDNPVRLLEEYKKELYAAQPTRWEAHTSRFRYRMALTVYALSFFFGLLAALGLLHYNGEAPVNVVYFFFVAVILPFMAMLLSVAALLNVSSAHNAWLHLTLTYVVETFTRRRDETLRRIGELEPRIYNWTAALTAQTAALWFSFGMLLGLVATVATQDIAFAWSTTFNIDSESFARFVRFIAAPWSAWIPEAVPSEALVETSRYFRLGGKVDPALVAHASELGAWWKFLAMSVAVYVVLPRMLLWLFARYRIGKIVKKALLQRPETRRYLEAFCTPVVEHTPRSDEAVYSPDAEETPRLSKSSRNTYDTVAAVSFDKELLEAYLEAAGIEAERKLILGGSATPQEDMKRIDSVKGGTTAVIVKGWEPPLRDTTDLIAAVAERSDEVAVIPVGLPETNFKLSQNDAEGWRIAIARIDKENVCLII
jgi:hypothetical protein